jgi:hypothetical protein
MSNNADVMPDEIPHLEAETLKALHTKTILPIWEDSEITINDVPRSEYMSSPPDLKSLNTIMPEEALERLKEAQVKEEATLITYNAENGKWLDLSNGRLFRKVLTEKTTQPQSLSEAAVGNSPEVADTPPSEAATTEASQTGKHLLSWARENGEFTAAGKIAIGAVALAAVGLTAYGIHRAKQAHHSRQQAPDTRPVPDTRIEPPGMNRAPERVVESTHLSELTP